MFDNVAQEPPTLVPPRIRTWPWRVLNQRWYILLLKFSLRTKPISWQIKKLNKRTGASAILLVTRGHLNDINPPASFETSNASGFCEKVLGHRLIDVAAKLESWNAVANQSTSLFLKILRSIWIQSLRWSHRPWRQGLAQEMCWCHTWWTLYVPFPIHLWPIFDFKTGEITGKNDLAMNYINYDTSIIARYKVRLIGWPPRVPFANPSTLWADDLQRLTDAQSMTQFYCKKVL